MKLEAVFILHFKVSTLWPKWGQHHQEPPGTTPPAVLARGAGTAVWLIMNESATDSPI